MASPDTSQQTEHKSFQNPDETREFPNGRAEILNIGGGEVGRLVFEPGWRWSNDVKPIAGTDSCEAPHFQYHVSGRLAVRMDDGTEIVAGPGDITSLPSGHDAWVVGDEPAVSSTGMEPATTRRGADGRPSRDRVFETRPHPRRVR
jgi:hypothetical protein